MLFWFGNRGKNIDKNGSASVAKDRLLTTLRDDRSMSVAYLEDLKGEMTRIAQQYVPSSRIDISTFINRPKNRVDITIQIRNG